MLLEIRGLTKTYRKGAQANAGIDLAVAEGEVFGLLGHNGAGKTTLVNQVVGLLRPDTGQITIDGRDVVADPGYARRVCSVQPQAQVPLDGLTPRQAIDLVGRIRGGSRAVVAARSAHLAEALDIGEWMDKDGRKLSGGVKRLVSFAMASVMPGRLVVFDEPTNDVDPVRRRLLWGQVRRAADGGAAVLLVTHNVVEAERAVDRLAILDHGRVIETGTPAQLKARVADDIRLELVLEPGALMPSLPGFVEHAVSIGQRHVATVPAAAVAEAVGWVERLKHGGVVEEYRLGPATLEDVYVELVGRSDALASGDAPAATADRAAGDTVDAAPAPAQEEALDGRAA